MGEASSFLFPSQLRTGTASTVQAVKSPQGCLPLEDTCERTRGTEKGPGYESICPHQDKFFATRGT